MSSEYKIGAAIKSLREARAISQAKLAERAAVSRGYLSQIESDDVLNPSAEVVYRLAQVLCVTVEQIVTGRGGSDRVTELEAELAVYRDWLTVFFEFMKTNPAPAIRRHNTKRKDPK